MRKKLKFSIMTLLLAALLAGLGMFVYAAVNDGDIQPSAGSTFVFYVEAGENEYGYLYKT